MHTTIKALTALGLVTLVSGCSAGVGSDIVVGEKTTQTVVVTLTGQAAKTASTPGSDLDARISSAVTGLTGQTLNRKSSNSSVVYTSKLPADSFAAARELTGVKLVTNKERNTKLEMVKPTELLSALGETPLDNITLTTRVTVPGDITAVRTSNTLSDTSIKTGESTSTAVIETPLEAADAGSITVTNDGTGVSSGESDDSFYFLLIPLMVLLMIVVLGLSSI